MSIDSDRRSRALTRALSLQSLIPELSPPFVRTSPVRIPELNNVALTRRALAIIDHPDFQRLRSVRQLGPTHWVYPGAVHTRFEHSIGVFSCVRSYLLSLLQDPPFVDMVTEGDLLAGLAAGLLHDIGHYPFAHSLEALHHKGESSPRHEVLAGQIIRGTLGRSCATGKPISELLQKEWSLDPERVIQLIDPGRPGALTSPVDKVLRSVLSSTIDADKMDYLERDSIHLGVPYGRNYDRERLLSSLRIGSLNDAVAVTEKGRVAAEIFVFCRYTMFSEVYWHHTVRSASAMVERALADVRQRLGEENLDLARTILDLDDEGFMKWLWGLSPTGTASRTLIQGLASGGRCCHKRILTLGRSQVEVERRQAFEKAYGLTLEGTRTLEGRLAHRLGQMVRRLPDPGELIVDIPPKDKDALEDIEIIHEGLAGQRRSLRLSEMSGIMRGVGDDFAKVVKKIRVFVAPDLSREIRDKVPQPALEDALIEEILQP